MRLIDFHRILYTVLEKFTVGNRYRKSEIKEILRTIYEELGYNKTPKASDIENYFKTRVIQIIDPITKKKDNGFELLQKLEYL